MIKEIKLTTKAENDLENIREYLIGYEPYFDKLMDRINNYLKIIKYNPEIGKVGRRLGTREFFVYKTNYIIVYRVKQDTIEILKILHTSMQY
ncbi:MAG: type II toxin-antitoxin system RelE/ParE family toxin [Alphaproteobacteria bacterium]|jgi:addiction module RelE/StbE family toxin|nr:type II toxin-antitoxin system RelE/ParE family toxin [Alphaproteobacteria bacterium]